VSINLRAAFAAFIERIPPPSGLPVTPETIILLKKKGVELRDQLAALEPLKGTWTRDQSSGYYIADFQRKLIFCRLLRVNQLVSAPMIVV